MISQPPFDTPEEWTTTQISLINQHFTAEQKQALKEKNSGGRSLEALT